MLRLLKTYLSFLVFLAVVSMSPAGAAPSEKRLALVIGNASYKAKALPTAANDAALVAQTLQAAGFDVTGARDLDEDLLRKAFRDFVDRVAKAGQEAVVVVYFAGYGLQLEGENYLVPIDTDLATASDVPLRALRLSEQTRALAALHLKTTFVILDAARASPFAFSGSPPAAGLAWVEPENNMLIAFNAAPGTVSPEDRDGYGPYAKSLVEMIREGGLAPATLFERVRLRVNELTKGAQVPWDASKIERPFAFLERRPGAPPRADSTDHTAWMRSKSMRALGIHDAYMVALMRDTFDGYADFLADYWHEPLTKRVRGLIAARREAITWRRTYQANLPDAYWSYLERYPRGPHVADAGRLLTHLGAAIAPPAKFARMEYVVPPPLPDELEFIERPVLVFDDPAFALEPPPPSPAYFLEPPPPEFLTLAPPAAPQGAHILPAPPIVPIPAYVRVPDNVLVPPVAVAGGTRATDSTRDVRTKPDGRAASSISPAGSGNANNVADVAAPEPAVAPKAASAISQRSPSSSVDPVGTERIKELPQSPPSPVSLMPLGPIGNTVAWEDIKALVGLPKRAASTTPLWPIDNPPAWAQMKAPLSLPLQAHLQPQASGVLPGRATDQGPQVPATTALAPPLSNSPVPRTPRDAASSPEATGSLPLPARRRPMPTQPSTHNQSRPIPNAADSTSSTTAPSRKKLSPSTVVVRAPITPDGSSPKPQ